MSGIIAYSTYESGKAAKEGSERAAEATVASTEKNIEFQKWLWGEQREGFQPYMEAGERALGEYETQIGKGFTLDDMYKDPGYQFRFSEGQKAYETSAAAKGMQLSGAQVKGLTRFGQDYGSQEYQAAFNRRQTGLDNLYRMIAGGQASAAGTATTGTAMGQQVSGAISQAGQATSQMYSDVGNIRAAQWQAPVNTLMDIGGMYAQYAGAKA